MKGNKLLKFLTIILLGCEIFGRRTQADSDGDGNIIFLDRHSVYCNEGEALNGFKLVTPGKDKIAIDYDCIKTEAITEEGEYTDYTGWYSAADDWFAQTISANRLSGIPVSCKNDFGLRGFKLESKCGKPICDIRFQFTCVPLKPTTCLSGKTGWIDAEDGQTYTLEKLWISLPTYHVLTDFALDVNTYSKFLQRDGKYFRYSFNYCNLRNVENEKLIYSKDKAKPTKGARTINDNHLQLLDGQ
jgi:hypothetical protein